MIKDNSGEGQVTELDLFGNYPLFRLRVTRADSIRKLLRFLLEVKGVSHAKDGQLQLHVNLFPALVLYFPRISCHPVQSIVPPMQASE